MCCWAPCCSPGLRHCCCRAPGTVDQYFLRIRCSAANPPHAAAAFDWWERLTDGRTPDRFIDSAPHTMRTVSKSESSYQITDAQPHWIFCEDSEYTSREAWWWLLSKLYVTNDVTVLFMPMFIHAAGCVNNHSMNGAHGWKHDVCTIFCCCVSRLPVESVAYHISPPQGSCKRH